MRKKRTRTSEHVEEPRKSDAIPESKLVITGALANAICPQLEHGHMTHKSVVVTAVSAVTVSHCDWMQSESI